LLSHDGQTAKAANNDAFINIIIINNYYAFQLMMS